MTSDILHYDDPSVLHSKAASCSRSVLFTPRAAHLRDDLWQSRPSVTRDYQADPRVVPRRGVGLEK